MVFLTELSLIKTAYATKKKLNSSKTYIYKNIFYKINYQLEIYNKL
jgi:hypothetical protein